jgi:hypothetical protein
MWCTESYFRAMLAGSTWKMGNPAAREAAIAGAM